MGSISIGRSQLPTKSSKELKGEVEDSLMKVIDPELGISIVELGLVYEVKVFRLIKKGGWGAEIRMTLTSPGCPLAGVINERVKEAVRGVEGVEKVTLKLVWEPMWSIDMVSDEVKMRMGWE